MTTGDALEAARGRLGRRLVVSHVAARRVNLRDLVDAEHLSLSEETRGEGTPYEEYRRRFRERAREREQHSSASAPSVAPVAVGTSLPNGPHSREEVLTRRASK